MYSGLVKSKGNYPSRLHNSKPTGSSGNHLFLSQKTGNSWDSIFGSLQTIGP